MKEKCDSCGDIEDTYITVVHEHVTDAWRLNYCYGCANRIITWLKGLGKEVGAVA